MLTVTLTQKKAKVAVLVLAGGGDPVYHQAVNPLSPKVQAELARLLRVEPRELLRHLLQADDAGYTFQAPGAGGDLSGEFTVRLRGIRQPGAQAAPVAGPDPAAAIRHALTLDLSTVPNLGPEPVAEWDGTDRLCVVDVDYHGLPLAQRPTAGELSALAAAVLPRPVAWHTSHGRGCKLYYAARGGYLASELGAVAALGWQQADKRATFELKRESRHPAAARDGLACGPVHTETGDGDLAAVAGLFNVEADPEQVREWLDARGWRKGEHRPHADCLIAADAVTHGSPVLVGDLGIFCHHCERHGRVYPGRRRAGFVSWGDLTGAVDGRLAGLVRRWVHWHHAKHTLRHLIPHTPDDLLAQVYRAALKLVHKTDPDDERVEAAMTAADMIRVGGSWVLGDGGVSATQRTQEAVAKTLPAFPDAVSQALATNGGNDLSPYGYSDLYPVAGVRMWGQWCEYPAGLTPLTRHLPDGQLPPDLRPRYRPAGRRMDVAKAWEVVEETFPGIDRRYLETLLCMRAIVEGQVDTPAVLVTGPTGAGKSAVPMLAHDILGATNEELVYSADAERLRQRVIAAADRGSGLMVINEAFKDGARGRLTPREVLEPLLTMTPDSYSHVMYVGPKKLGKRVGFVITDTEAPKGVFQNAQLARRIYEMPLARAVHWKGTLAAAGLSNIAGWRASSRDRAAAGDAILSDLTDRYFTSPVSWPWVAEQLGLKPLGKGDGSDDPDARRRAFFRAVCEAPALAGRHAARHPGRGWKLVSRDYTEGDLLSELWLENCNAKGSQGDWQASTFFAERDWLDVLDLPKTSPVFATQNVLPSFGEPVKLDVKADRDAHVLVRFRAGGSRHTPALVNAEIASADGTLPAHLRGEADAPPAQAA